MEEEKTTKQMLDDKIRECIEGLKFVEQGGEQHNALVNDIQKLTAAYAELEKMDHAFADSDRKFSEEMRQKDLELHYKDSLERDKMYEAKKSIVRDICIRLAGDTIKTVPYVLLLALGMKLEFAESGSITSFTVKELFRSLHPRV